MNQTKKRLSIINLAISITDIETIQLQILKLRLLKTDDKIQEIVATLQDENYAQAQALIKTYIDTPNNEILQRTFQREREKRLQDQKAVKNEFDLFEISNTKKSENKIIEFEEMLQMAEEVEANKILEKSKKESDFDALLDISSDDIMPNNIKLDVNHTKHDKLFWESLEPIDLRNDDIGKDTFFDADTPAEEMFEEKTFDPETFSHTDEIEVENRQADSEKKDEPFQIEEISQEEIDKILQPVKTKRTSDTTQEEEDTFFSQTEEDEKNIKVIEEISMGEDEAENSDEHYEEVMESEKIPEEEYEEPASFEKKEEIQEIVVEKKVEKTEKSYLPITYVDQKLKNLKVQYPLNHEEESSYASVDSWLLYIANNAYSEKDIENIFREIEGKKEAHPAEAAQLLLIAAATESKYAQFQLARALYRGEILEKNLPEAFTLFNRLAVNDNYPEAICDLAQLYEYGIGIHKDKKKAEELYEEAMELGVKRAEAHYGRIHKENRSFFAFLKK